MKTFIADIIPKIQRYSQKLDNITLLTNQHWVVVDEIANSKNVYIFRSNNELLISQNGKVEKARWEYLGNNALLIDRKDESYLFKHGFFDENVLALKVDGKEEFAILVNESKYNKELNSLKSVVEFLNIQYIELHTIKNDEPLKGINQTVDEFVSSESDLPDYSETDPIEQYDIFNGRHFSISVSFCNNLQGEIYLGGESNKYFLQYGLNGIIYFENKINCIKYLYKHLKI